MNTTACDNSLMVLRMFMFHTSLLISVNIFELFIWCLQPWWVRKHWEGGKIVARGGMRFSNTTRYTTGCYDIMTLMINWACVTWPWTRSTRLPCSFPPLRLLPTTPELLGCCPSPRPPPQRRLFSSSALQILNWSVHSPTLCLLQCVYSNENAMYWFF